ncbi:MAG: DUF885 domain-containing protein [Candidatus Eisenbacteria bacterium]|nr:DUF885 domain-containing protein [Candidatus Eisenbacteria bacterium]
MRPLLKRVPPVATLALLLATCVPAAAAPAGSADAQFERLAHEYLDGWLARRPDLATRLGLHREDALLSPVSQATLAEDAARARSLQARLAAIPRDRLSFERALDHDLLAARLARERLDLEVLRPFERDPGAYVELVAGSVQSLLEHDSASPCSRVRAVAARLDLVPEVLRAARINLRDPSRLAIEEAIGRFEGTLRLYREALPALAAGCRDDRAQADLAEADTTAIRAVEDFLVTLREDLLPRATDDFAAGDSALRILIATDEREPIPLDSLRAAGEQEMDSTRARMARLAGRIAPGGGVAAALDSLRAYAPTDTALVAALSSAVAGVRAFLGTHAIVTPPGRENLRVREAPPFARAADAVTLDLPGPWEREGAEAGLEVVPIEPGWGEERRREHRSSFDPWSAVVAAIREAVPGRYYQALAARRAPSRLRQAVDCAESVRGWADYCEAMMIQQGFGEGDPRYELAQQAIALRRLGRFVAAIELHTRQVTLEQAAAMLEARCFLAPAEARREARRAARDPDAIAGTCGRWRILALRGELERALGPRFQLAAFHDAFLRPGRVPLRAARAALFRELAGAPEGRKP